MFVGPKVFDDLLGFICDICPIRAVRSGKVRENNGEMSGNSNRADHWEP